MSLSVSALVFDRPVQLGPEHRVILDPRSDVGQQRVPLVAIGVGDDRLEQALENGPE